MPQSLSNVLVHLVFSTFHRDPTLTEPVTQHLYPYMITVLKNDGCRVVQIGGVADHIHILFAQSRTECLSDLVKAIKGSSSGLIKDLPSGRKDFAWQAGYGAFSVGAREVEPEIRYIQNQQEHHRVATFKDEFRELMRLANMEVDERYAWE
ncbi:MAG TPA: IS200/IS605 family transposase [Fimbriimonadaceae bacterium]|jgi:REP element-mobilizing transposase RayT